MRVKLLLKRLTISIVIFLMLIGIVLTIALNFVFTPEKITPLVVDVLNEQLNAEVHCDAVELTFFSTFPRFGAQLKNTTLVTLHTGTEKDTLASFANAAVEIDLLDYLRNHNINVEQVRIFQPKLYVYADKNGTTNWNILKETENEDTTTSDSLQINDITVHHLDISKATLIHDDIATHLKHRINNFSLNLSAIKTDERIAVTMHTASDNVEAYYKDVLFHTFESPGMEVRLDLNRATRVVHIDSKDITVNNIHFKANGVLEPNREECAAQLAIHAQLATSDIANFVQAVPKAFLPKEHIVAKGAVFFDVDVTGLYGSGNLPKIEVNMRLKDGSIAYENIGGRIDAFSTAARAAIYPDGAQKSSITIDTLQVQGTGIALVGNLSVEDVLGEAYIQTALDGDINLTALYNSFPIDRSMQLEGRATAALQGDFSIADIQQEQYENINLSGDLALQGVVFKMPSDSIEFSSEKSMVRFYRATEGLNHTAVALDIQQTNVSYKGDKTFKAREMQAHASVQEAAGNNKRKRKHFALQLHAVMQAVTAHSTTDSLDVILQRTELNASLHPRQGDKATYVTTNFTIDSLGVRYGKHLLGVSKGGYRMELERLGRKKWRPEGTVGFRKLFAKAAGVAKPLRMPAGKLSFKADDFKLDHAALEFGQSAVVVNGTLNHTRGFFNGEKVAGTLQLSSDYIDANELMATFAGATAESTTSTQATDTTVVTSATTKQAFAIPDSLAFNFTTNIKKLHFGQTDLTDLHGDLELQQGRLQLHNFSLTTEAAALQTQLTYTPNADHTAKLDFTFQLDHIAMNKLGTVFPVLDSLLPACKSFVGVADFRMQGTARLNEQLELNSEDLDAIAAIRAKDIMVLDGPTFSELAKTLKFKSKAYNPVERLAVEMQLHQNTVTILPALLEIDRYRLAFGGEQHLDMSYNYHVSVLKSPIPFKMGVNVLGDTMDDYKIKLVKAKYKYYFTDKERLQKKADTTIINTKERIRKQLGFETLVVADDSNMIED